MSASRIDVQPAHLRLLRAHVLGRADEVPELREQRLVRQPLAASPSRCRSRSPSAPASPSCTVTRMFDGLISRWMMPFLMRVLHRLADLENSSSRARVGEPVLSQYSVIGIPQTQLHHEIRPAVSVAPAS